MSDVFISYARSTAYKAADVAAALLSMGYDVWRDSEIPANRAFTDEIESHLALAKAVVVVWSAEAVKSQWVRSEADRARLEDKLVQLSIDGARLPMPFDQIECADLSRWAGEAENPEWRKVLASVVELVNRHQERQATPGQRPTLPAPEKPSIAVLPFKNLAGAKGGDYFADAVTEDIVTALSRQHLFFVIASSSSFTYRGLDVDLGRIGRELGVRYILKGGIRKLGHRVRVTVQLVVASDGSSIWADSFDRELVDLLALQDEITEKVVAAIEPAVLHSEGMRVVRKSLADFSALDCFYRGMWQLNRVSKGGYDEALALFSEAIRRDPDLSLGHIGLARILFGGAVFGWSAHPVEDLGKAREAAQVAIRLDPRDAYGYFACSGPSLYLGQHGAALSEARTAVGLNPNCAMAQVRIGQALIFSGRPAEAIAPIKRGMRLSPYDSQLGVMLDSLSLAAYLVGDYEQAIVHAREAMHHNFASASVVLAASLAQLGRLDEARTALPPTRWNAGSPQRPMAAPYANPADLEHLRQGVRLARSTGQLAANRAM
ncbi:MAG TPA: TIR domain-containing protein [Phenylobacterium sp.]|jgi:TolB-like protein|nr:TIR domain-containing protein [Phenylobacterium sp.]